MELRRHGLVGRQTAYSFAVVDVCASLHPGPLKGCPTTKKPRPPTTAEKWAAHLLVCPRCAAMDRLSKGEEVAPTKTEPPPETIQP